MTKQQFVDILSSQWPLTRTCVRAMGLPRTCRLLALDAFTHGHQGGPVDTLRQQMLALELTGRFDFSP